MPAPENTTTTAPLRQKLEFAVLFLLLATIIFTFPNKPSFDLDSSWRMALGKFFLDHLQFGRDVVFTYGPLGFLMGKTYSGLLFWTLITWQLCATALIATLIMHWGQRMAAGWPRFFFYAFFLLFGVTYEDALHMLVIALIAFELVRRVGRPWHWSSSLMLLALATQSVAKFTNLMLAALVVVIVAALALAQRQRGTALRLLAWFAGGFLVEWMICGQNPLNLPAYFINSWHVSQGYQEAMGIATPGAPLWKALVIMTVLAAYLGLNFLNPKDRPRRVASGLILGALVYLNWKHGFVRSDGHMVGFFYCALLPIVAFPVLLEDAAPFGRLKRWGLAGAGVLCVLGVKDALPPLVDSALAIFQNRIWSNVTNAGNIGTLRDDYDLALDREIQRWGVPRVRKAAGNHSLDVFGFDQAIAIYNRLNYRPRPVFQSYSAYSPELARLNADFYRSERIPDFVLLKILSIDQRLPAMDDSAVLYLITHRYKYVLTENSFQLWARVPGPLDDSVQPRLLERRELGLSEAWSLKAHNSQPLWVQIDLQPSLLGRLRTFFYKPPILMLTIRDSAGQSTTYRMPAPIGRAGFIINPVVDDLLAFTRFAASKPERLADEIMIVLAPEDRKYFAATARAELSALKPSTAALEYFTQLAKERFYMFKTPPLAFEASNTPSNEQMDGTEVMVMHTPSEMTFNLPIGAKEMSGQFGILEGAYTKGGKTNGAEFVIVWSDGKESVEIFRRFLDPINKTSDRGLRNFYVDLKNYTGGRLYLRTLPGPYNDTGWDWTAWTNIEIR